MTQINIICEVLKLNLKILTTELRMKKSIGIFGYIKKGENDSFTQTPTFA